MNQERLALQLAALSEHDRFIAQAQLARAEAIVDAVAAIAGLVRRGWNALVSSARAWNDARTRQWPHPQALR
ncbi:MAG: hypothetical protein ACHQJ7_02660 [Vicinamibacteria bacterium]|jgi:hypothetical protein